MIRSEALPERVVTVPASTVPAVYLESRVLRTDTRSTSCRSSGPRRLMMRRVRSAAFDLRRRRPVGDGAVSNGGVRGAVVGQKHQTRRVSVVGARGDRSSRLGCRLSRKHVEVAAAPVRVVTVIGVNGPGCIAVEGVENRDPVVSRWRMFSSSRVMLSLGVADGEVCSRPVRVVMLLASMVDRWSCHRGC